MMWWGDGAWTGGDWLALLMLAVLVLVAAGVLVGVFVPGDASDPHGAARRPDDVLRYPNAEIGDDDYDRTRLHGVGSH